MAEIVPRHVLCVLGNWQSFYAVETVLARVGGSGFKIDREFSQLQPDERMMDSFGASYDRVTPSMTDADWQAMESHSAVAYILSPYARAETALDISRRALFLIAALLENGGVAAKSESAGIAHGRERWLELAADYVRAAKNRDEHSQRAALYWAFVRRPIQDDDKGVFYSCGMHLLGKRDAEIDFEMEVDSAVEWIDMLGLYLVAEQPQRPLRAGEGFRLRDAGPRRVMRFHPCARYDEDEFFFNPYGYIRLEDPDQPP
jgi:hypothetical protein